MANEKLNLQHGRCEEVRGNILVKICLKMLRKRLAKKERQKMKTNEKNQKSQSNTWQCPFHRMDSPPTYGQKIFLSFRATSSFWTPSDGWLRNDQGAPRKYFLFMSETMHILDLGICQDLKSVEQSFFFRKQLWKEGKCEKRIFPSGENLNM